MALTTFTVDPGTYPSMPVCVDNAGAGGYVQVMKLAQSAAGVTTLIPADANGIWIQGAGAAGAPAGGVLSVVEPDAVVSATLTASGQAATTATLHGTSTVAAYISGTFSGTVQFEATVDGVNWFSIYAAVVPGGTLASSATAGGAWQIDASAFAGVRVRCSAYTSGSIVVALRGSAATGAVALDAPLPVGANAIGGVYALPSTSSTYALTPYFPASGNIVAAFVKASAGALYGIMAVNQVAAVTWLCFYNKATAPVLGTDSPVWAVPIPGGAGTGILAMQPGSFSLASFSSGIAIAAATTPAGAAAPATAPTGMCFYK